MYKAFKSHLLATSRPQLGMKNPKRICALAPFCRDIEFSRYIRKGTELKNDRFQRVVRYSSENISKLRASLVQSILDLVLGYISSVSPLLAVHRVTDDP